MSSCNICNKRVQRHSYILQCSNCRGKVHLKCLPFVSKTDDIYTKKDVNTWYCTICTKNIFPFNHIDDDEDYLEALSENWSLYDGIPFNILKDHNKMFVPFELNEDEHLQLFELESELIRTV